MTDAEIAFEEEEIETDVSPEEAIAARKQIAERCKAAGIPFEEENVADEELKLKIGMKCGRSTRWLALWSDESILQLLSTQFEKYTFLSDLEAICSYSDGTIEAGVRPVGNNFMPSSYLFRRLFGLDRPTGQFDIESAKIVVPSTQEGLPHIEISAASDTFIRLCRSPVRVKFTLKLTGCHVSTHDAALAMLNKTAGAVFFQLDLLTDVPLSLEKERRRSGAGRRQKRRATQATELQYPKTQFDSAPLSLYWYGRSAAGEHGHCC